MCEEYHSEAIVSSLELGKSCLHFFCYTTWFLCKGGCVVITGSRVRKLGSEPKPLQSY